MSRRTAILTMDGGGPNNVLTTILLQRIEDARPGFLDRLDVVSGVSAGSITALILGTMENRHMAMQEASRVMNNMDSIFATDNLLLHAAVGLTGQRAFLSNENPWKFFTEYFQGKRLGDLKLDTVIPAMALDTGVVGTTSRRWRPVLMHNLKGVRHPAPDVLLVDALLRSAAPPILMPVYQGFIDGGVFADNPAMAALTLVLERFRHEKPHGARQSHGLENVMLLSMGAGEMPMYLETTQPSENWGYGKWLLDPHAPLAALQATFSGSQDIVDLQCRAILEADQYFRLNPIYRQPVSSRVQVGQHERVSIEDVARETDLTHVLHWLDKAGWTHPPGATTEPTRVIV